MISQVFDASHRSKEVYGSGIIHKYEYRSSQSNSHVIIRLGFTSVPTSQEGASRMSLSVRSMIKDTSCVALAGGPSDPTESQWDRETDFDRPT